MAEPGWPDPNQRPTGAIPTLSSLLPACPVRPCTPDQSLCFTPKTPRGRLCLPGLLLQHWLESLPDPGSPRVQLESVLLPKPRALCLPAPPPTNRGLAPPLCPLPPPQQWRHLSELGRRPSPVITSQRVLGQPATPRSSHWQEEAVPELWRAGLAPRRLVTPLTSTPLGFCYYRWGADTCIPASNTRGLGCTWAPPQVGRGCTLDRSRGGMSVCGLTEG